MNNEFKIKINTVENAKRFVDKCNLFKEDVDISTGRYIVDAKSIMALLSFDLYKILNVKIHTDNIKTIKRFNEEMEMFKVDD